MDRSLYPLFNEDLLLIEGREKFIYFPKTKEQISIDPHFTLFITTKLSNPHFKPEVAVYANLINFAVTQEGLQQQILNVIVADKKSELEQE